MRGDVGRADLLQLVLKGQRADLATAGLFGLEPEEGDSSSRKFQSGPLDAEEKKSGLEDEKGNASEPELDSDYPRYAFPLVTQTTMRKHNHRPEDQIEPLEDADLSVPWGRFEQPLPPLCPWPRLSLWLRQALGHRAPGRRLDMRRLMRQVGRGEVLHDLPKLERDVWHPLVVLLWDRSAEMVSFQRDLKDLTVHLRRISGLGSVKVEELRGNEDVIAVSHRIPEGIPVLAVSAMGAFTGSAKTRAAWSRLGEHLQKRGNSLTRLSPAPRERWEADLCRLWPSTVWDRRPRPPRRGGLSSLPPCEDRGHVVEDLLVLLSPAPRIEPPLLRKARLCLGDRADAGTEWEAWHHADCWGSLDSFGIRAGEPYAKRLQELSSLKDGQREMACTVAREIAVHLMNCGLAIRLEAALRMIAAGLMDWDEFDEALQHAIPGMLKRMRRDALRPNGEAGKRGGLADWFPGFVDRLSPEMRDHPELKDFVARGAALSAYFREEDYTVPEGMSDDLYAAETHAAGGREPEPVDYELILRGGELLLRHLSRERVQGAVPLAFFRAAKPSLFLRPGDRAEFRAERLQIPDRPGSNIPLIRLDRPCALRLESDFQTLSLSLLERPPWAERLVMDRHGVRAEFTIGGVRFVMRWIPPGRWCGEEEGPLENAQVTEGFWLGETQVTQAQWRAVIKASTPRPQAADHDPSHFQGPDELPVESVDWETSRNFCKAVGEVLLEESDRSGGFEFRLPSEVEWEHACRAGTGTDFYTGENLDTDSDTFSEALDSIAWYAGNAGIDLEVENPDKASDLLKMDWYRQKQLGIHAVKQKLPNPWGLYDMLGNVWEWTGTLDNASGTTKENAGRVVRGGSWSFPAGNCRAAIRGGHHPGLRFRYLGLRLAAGQPPEAVRVERKKAGRAEAEGRRPARTRRRRKGGR